MRAAIPAVLLLACAIPASAADPRAGVIRVAATYPGADARTVDEAVLAPLFAQINGVEGATRIESEARNDGTGILTVHFEPKADLNLAQAMVQNRASLALPVIPAACRRLGMSVRKLPAGPPAFWLALTSADDKHDAEFLTTCARVYLKNELARLPGVANVRVVGAGEFGVRVGLNPDRLRAYSLTVGDVVAALRRQNAGAAAGAAGGQALPFAASGRLARPDQFSAVILKANPNGEILRLKDVAKVEPGAAGVGFARVDGKPAALIAVAAWPGRVTAEQLLKVEGAGDLPPGMRLGLIARSADRLLEVEVRLPGSAPPERTEKVVGRAAELIAELPGGAGTVAISEGHEPNAATILVRLPAKGGPTAAEVRKALAAIPDAATRVGAAPPGGEAFPVRLALTDPRGQGEDALREAADDVVKRLAKGAGVTGVTAVPGAPVRQFAIDVDRDRCATLGVKLAEVFTTLRAAGGGVHATDFTRFGRAWPVTVQAVPGGARRVEDLTMLWVRTAAGEMVPLEKLLKVRKVLAPPAVVRVNGQRAIVVTADPPAGQTPAQAADLCVKLARDVLPRGYYLKDLTGRPH